MSKVQAKWLHLDTQSLEDDGSGNARVKIDGSGGLARGASGVKIKALGVTDAMLAGSISLSKLAAMPEHDNLVNVDSGTYRHLSAAQVTDLTDGNDTDLHTHNELCNTDGDGLIFATTSDQLSVFGNVFGYMSQSYFGYSAVIASDVSWHAMYSSVRRGRGSNYLSRTACILNDTLFSFEGYAAVATGTDYKCGGFYLRVGSTPAANKCAGQLIHWVTDSSGSTHNTIIDSTGVRHDGTYLLKATTVSGTYQVITDIQNNAGSLEFKSRDITVSLGKITTITSESGWTTVPSV